MVHNPKIFHAYIRNEKVARVGIGPLKSPEGQIINESVPMANMFDVAFTSVYSHGTPANPFPHQAYGGMIGGLGLTQEYVVKAVAQLD